MSKYIYLLMLMYGCVFSQDECSCAQLNTWYKISNNPNNYGQLLELDLSYGYAIADPYTIYLILMDRNSGEEMVIQFTNNSNFRVDNFTPYQPDENEKFDLQKYLELNKGKGSKLEKLK